MPRVLHKSKSVGFPSKIVRMFKNNNNYGLPLGDNHNSLHILGYFSPVFSRCIHVFVPVLLKENGHHTRHSPCTDTTVRAGKLGLPYRAKSLICSKKT